MQRKNLSISVKKFYTDVDGNIIDKNTEFPIGSEFRVNLPVWLWGKFDYRSQYSISRRLTPFVSNAWKFFNMYVAASYEFLVFSGANGIRSQIGTGDVVFVYTDDVINPTYFVFIVVTGQNLNPYASIVQDVDGSLISLMFKYDSVQNPFNYQQELEYIQFDKLGNSKRSTIQPDTFLPPSNKHTDVIDIELEMMLTEYFSLNTYLLFETDIITFTHELAGDFQPRTSSDFYINAKMI